MYFLPAVIIAVLNGLPRDIKSCGGGSLALEFVEHTVTYGWPMPAIEVRRLRVEVRDKVDESVELNWNRAGVLWDLGMCMISSCVCASALCLTRRRRLRFVQWSVATLFGVSLICAVFVRIVTVPFQGRPGSSVPSAWDASDLLPRMAAATAVSILGWWTLVLFFECAHATTFRLSKRRAPENRDATE